MSKCGLPRTTIMSGRGIPPGGVGLAETLNNINAAAALARDMLRRRRGWARQRGRAPDVAETPVEDVAETPVEDVVGKKPVSEDEWLYSVE